MATIHNKIGKIIEAAHELISLMKDTTPQHLGVSDEEWSRVQACIVAAENALPALEEMQADCIHSWVTADKDNHGDGRSYCEYCGADGDA